MRDDRAQRQLVTLDDVLEQHDQLVDLLRREGLPVAPGSGLVITLVDQFDADRRAVQPGAPLPFADPRVPGAAVLVHQAVDGRRGIADQVVAAHLGVRQQVERALQIGGGVVQHHILHATVLASGRVAVIDAQAARAAREQNND